MPHTRFTPERFASVWLALGLTAPDGLFDALSLRYAEPHRAYHTAEHLEECLAALDLVRSQCESPAAVELALWFHDAIYDTRASDNEQRSADWAAQELESADAAVSLVHRVRALIMATRHNAIPASGDEEFLTDADLSILGARSERFLQYEEQVRREYSWVPDPLFQRERAKILRAFLSRPSIYATEFFRETLEARARQNLEGSIERLEAGI